MLGIMKVQIAIIGNSQLSLWLQHLLQNEPGVSFCVINQPFSEPVGTGQTYGGLQHLITRPVQTFSEKIGLQAYSSALEALPYFVEKLDSFKTPYKHGSLVRLPHDELEAAELEESTELLAKIGFQQTQFTFQNSYAVKLENGSLSYDITALQKALLTNSKPAINDQVTSVTATPNGCELILESGKIISAEFVIFANHANIRDLFLPSRECIFPAFDQTSLRSTETKHFEDIYYFSRHSQIEIKAISDDQFYISGARYLRPKDDNTEWHDQVDRHIVSEIFPWLDKSRLLKKMTSSYAVSCDELPLIGPWPGDERLLVATGFPSNWDVFSFLAATVLKDIIFVGSADSNATAFSPRRMQL
jgi:hypothetical protein